VLLRLPSGQFELCALATEAQKHRIFLWNYNCNCMSDLLGACRSKIPGQFFALL
jgi:hypothetical protein